MTKIFSDRWALILGASSGFGAAAAKRLAEAGMNIAGVHLDRKSTMENVSSLQAEIRGYGVKEVFFNMNAADADKRLEVIQHLRELAPGKIGVVMHSLAFGTLKPFAAEDKKDSIQKSQMDMTLDVMANSLVYWAQDLIEAKLLAKPSSIYAMTSAGSSRVWKSYGAVSAAKCALESHCRQLALELAPHGVAVNAILAGVTDTPALRKIPGNETMVESATKRNPMGRLTTPDDIAKALVAFSMPHCAFMTGNTIRIDGGENIVD